MRAVCMIWLYYPPTDINRDMSDSSQVECKPIALRYTQEVQSHYTPE